MMRLGCTWRRKSSGMTGTFGPCDATRAYATKGASRLLGRVICRYLVIAVALSACVSTRPVVKIGLLAPFEGLHRESGYEALSAMRAALAEHPLPDVEVLPLALDTSADSAQARRAAAKLLRDGSVVAVVGPMQPRQVAAVADLIAATDVAWQVPTAPSSAERAQALVAAFLAQIDGQRIVLAGQDDGWPQLSSEEWSARTGKSVTVGDEAEIGASVDGILWLGDAQAGAAFLTHLRSTNRTIPFWTTGVGGDPVFSLLLQEQLGGESLGPVYWGVALDGSAGSSPYGEWAATHAPDTPTAYAVYRATQRALEQVAGHGGQPDKQGLAVFTLDRTGTSTLTEVVPFP